MLLSSWKRPPAAACTHTMYSWRTHQCRVPRITFVSARVPCRLPGKKLVDFKAALKSNPPPELDALRVWSHVDHPIRLTLTWPRPDSAHHVVSCDETTLHCAISLLPRRYSAISCRCSGVSLLPSVLLVSD